jgi:CubicO group peptidase (beta-lactamase class C family)
MEANMRGRSLIVRTLGSLLAAWALTAPAHAADRPVVAGESGRKRDAYLSRLERFGFSGGALAVRGRDVLLMKSYGLADRGRAIPLTTDSVYSLGSITKQFTAAAILTLEMAGALSVNDRIGQYLDDVPADKASITLHHLLTHSSGLESDFSPTDFEPVEREDYVARALRSRLLFPPGDGYEYSNAGYSLLAAIVERVSRQDYESYLAAHVLKPAGMSESGYKGPRWAAERVAHGYREGEDWGTLVDRISPPGAPFWPLRGNGALQTTLPDMLAWHRALESDRVLSKPAREKYFKPHVAEGPTGRSFYAYGWAVGKTRRGTAVVQHNGGNGIYVAEFLRFPDEDAMLFLTSTDADVKATPVVEVLERILFGAPYQPPPLVVALPTARLASLAGEWRLPKGGTLRLAVDGPALAARAEEPEAFAALRGAPTGAASERLSALTARMADIAPRAFQGDVTGLHQAMGGDMSLDELRSREADVMQDRERRLGRFRRAAVLGSVPGEDDTVRTFVRLEFEKGSVYNIYTWGPRRLLGIRGIPRLPAIRLLPISSHEFMSFSLGDEPPAVRVVFEEKDGETMLRLGGPGAGVVARRASESR